MDSISPAPVVVTHQIFASCFIFSLFITYVTGASFFIVFIFSLPFSYCNVYAASKSPPAPHSGHDDIKGASPPVDTPLETGDAPPQDNGVVEAPEQSPGSEDGVALPGWEEQESGNGQDSDLDIDDGDLTLSSGEPGDEDGDDNGDETDCEDEIVVATGDSHPRVHPETRFLESVARRRSTVARIPEFQTPSSTDPEGDSLLEGATLVNSNRSRLTLAYDTLDLQPEEGEKAPSPEPPHNIPSPPGKAGDQFPYVPGVGWIDPAPRYSDTKKLIARIEKKYSITERQFGVVYILKHKNYKNLFKVGTTKHEIGERLSGAPACAKDNSDVIYLPESSFWGAVRAEALVKADMVDRNLAIRTCQHCSTPKSIQSHTEWFKTTSDDVRRCVVFWEDFVKSQCDEDGFRGDMVSVLKQVLLTAGASSPSSRERSRGLVERSEEPSPSLGRARKRATTARKVDPEEDGDDDDHGDNESSEPKEPTQKHTNKGTILFSLDKTVTNNVTLQDISLPKTITRASKTRKRPGRGITKPTTQRITSSDLQSLLVPMQVNQAPA